MPFTFLRDVEEQVDRAAAELWGLTDAEPADIRRNLRDLRGERPTADGCTLTAIRYRLPAVG